MIIAIDGPAASGKSTVAKILAKELDLVYLDTGAMYRIITYFALECLNNNLSQEGIISCLGQVEIGFVNNQFTLNSILVGDEIRTKDIDLNVSFVAGIKEVREFAVKIQREIASKYNSILDGRDIGTVVFKNADYKFYFEASAEKRAKRRFLERPDGQDVEEVLTQIIKRDNYDKNRKESPLVMAKDAIKLDTSDMSVDDVVEYIKKIIEIRL